MGDQQPQTAAGASDLDVFRRQWKQEVEYRHGKPQQDRRGSDPSAGHGPDDASQQQAASSHGLPTSNLPTADKPVDREAGHVADASAAALHVRDPAGVGAETAAAAARERVGKASDFCDAPLSPRSHRRRREAQMQQMHTALQRAIGEESDDEDQSPGLSQNVSHSASTHSCETSLCDRLYMLDVYPSCEPESPTSLTHFSALPVEVVLHIFRWVVSSNLDLHSLEQLSEVCQWFYMCSRSEGLWRLICRRIWGKSTDSASPALTWREHFLHTPHPLHHGCYISCTIYFRYGERSLDDFYKPYHSVVYYRFYRFYMDGTLLVGQGTAHPRSVVQKFEKDAHSIAGVELFRGTYVLEGEQIFGAYSVERQLDDEAAAAPGQGRNNQRRNHAPVVGHRNFHMCWNIQPVKHRPFCQLVWDHYYIENAHPQHGVVSHDDIHLGSKFPPLFFSRVKSYTPAATDSV